MPPSNTKDTKGLSLRFKIMGILFLILSMSLITFTLFAISKIQKEKSTYLYYSLLTENVALGDRLAQAIFDSNWDSQECTPITAEFRERLAPGVLSLTGADKDVLLMERTSSTGNSQCKVRISKRKILGKIAGQSLSNIYLLDYATNKTIPLNLNPAAAQRDFTAGHELASSIAKIRVSQGTLDFNSHDKKRVLVGSFYKIKNQTLALIVEIPKESVLQEFKRMSRDLMYFAIIVSSISVLMSLFFSNKLIAPLAKLKLQADELAAGRYDFKVDIRARDEIGDLAKHFSRLGDRLSQREKELEIATDMAHKDGMTQLFNYRFFKTQLEKDIQSAKQSNQQLSIVLIDVDHFKKINDTYGHPQGDHVLKVLAGILRECARDTDYCCRYGGEEFIIIMHNTPGDLAQKIAETIRTKFETNQIEVLGTQKMMKQTLSSGIATLDPKSNQTLAQLVSEADAQLYRAKENGRNRSYFLNQKVELKNA